MTRPVRVLAHRGASAYATENTLAALDLAVEMGADAIEFDLRPGPGGELVALHDEAGGRSAEPPPTLDAILARYGSSTHYAIDMKDPTPAGDRALVAAVERHGAAERVELMSFWRDSLERVREMAPGLALVPLYRRAVEAGDVLADLDRAATIGRAIGRATELVDAELMDAARARGLAVYAYVVNDEAEMERLVGLGVEGLISDVPDRALAFVKQRAGG